MSSQPVCPCCRSPQATQRVAAIVAGGTQHVHVVTADLVPGAGTARSRLAQLLAPPHRLGGGGVILVVCLALLLAALPPSCVAAMMIFELQGIPFEEAMSSGGIECLFAVIFGSAVLLCVALLVGLNLLHYHGAGTARLMSFKN
jgi:hypothetical protein